MDSIGIAIMQAYSGNKSDLIGFEDVDGIDRFDEFDFLMHYGVGPDDNPPGRGSGRYEKGSGEDAYQHAGDFFTRVKRMRKEHPEMNDNEIAIAVGCKNTNDLRTRYTQDLNKYRLERNIKIREMLDSGMKQQQVADSYGVPESTLRSWLKESSVKRVTRSQELVDDLKKLVKEKGLIDVGAGVERELNVSKERLKAALKTLEDEGYLILGGRVPQATNPGKQTTVKCLADKDSEYTNRDVYQHPELIQSIKDYTLRETMDGEEKLTKKWQFPAAIDMSRVLVRYAGDICPDGHPAEDRDGTIEIRRNVPDLDLQGSHYAQCRIMTNEQTYLKGVAIYSDDIPEGYDVVFNTSKPQGRKDLALKKIKKDPDNPFGALLREKGGQYEYTDENGETKLGLINKTRQEGDWEDWEDTLPHQFLEKQSLELIKKQLGIAIGDKKAEYEDILRLTNPTVKKKFLEDFSNQCDADAVDMAAAALPRQKYQLLLPVPTLADDEVYAPNFKDGETIALIRFPHAGQFEIPILKVNNKHPQGRAFLGDNPMDAIGVNKKNLEILSGADCDGDTVMCIPCNDPRYSTTRIQNRPPLEGLEGFDNKAAYGPDPETVTTIDKRVKADGTIEEVETVHYFRNGKEFKPMTRTGLEMGKITNLITDMTFKGATDDKIAMAVRHSMVVIDAEKHHLDWKASEKDNHIQALKEEFQERYDYDEEGNVDGKPHYGSSTLLSRAKSPVHIDKPRGTPHIDPETGKLVYYDSQKVPQEFVGKDGKVHTRQEEVHLLDTKDDAFELVSTYRGDRVDAYHTSPKEVLYALYSNELRAMANEARKEYLRTGDIKKNASAAEQYKEEADHLLKELEKSELNAPRERMAQYYASSVLLAKKEQNPDMTKKEKQKASQKALVEGRLRFQAERHSIDISPKEWEAIQAGAIASTNLNKILKYADMDKVREYASPRTGTKLTAGQESRIRNLLANGISAQEVADKMHISVSTVNNYRKGE